MNKTNQAVIKIDLCGSKKYYEKNKYSEPNITQITLDKLLSVVKEIFPYSNLDFPKGSLYARQGDCVYIILDKATIALRSSIEFMKKWFSILPSLPDCRAIIDYGEISIDDSRPRIELISECFENISVIEKSYGAGEIGVTEALKNNSDNTLVQFIKKKKIDITEGRFVNVFQANYEDPRLFQDSSLIHSLFVASSDTSNAREMAIEALILECLIERINKPISLIDLNYWLKYKNCPQIDQLLIDGIIQKSKYISKDKENNIVFKSSDTIKELNVIKEDFEAQRDDTIKKIALYLSDGLGLDTSIVNKELNLTDLVEKYLCAVFLEIRFMANYFKSTQLLFEKLSSDEDFDYIIKSHLSNSNSIGIEQFALLKKLFLDALTNVATKNNKYIASIFHNILMIYYLNRSEKYIHSQLEIMKQKEIYIDTNVLYSIKCKYSQYHDMLTYIIDNLNRLGAQIFVFEKSVAEYNDSLTTTFKKYKNDTLNFLHQEKKPWIWYEYENNINSYQNSFEYCISLHHIPINTNNSIDDSFEEARKELSQRSYNRKLCIGINIIKKMAYPL